MPLAAKHFDIVLGVDVHIVQPPGTVPPAPVPHPFVGIVLDPFDYIPRLGSTVSVNGLPRGLAGTAAMPIPSHMPIGGVFIKPPGNDSELFMGSKTVMVEGQPFAYLGLPALSCSDIGMPPPLRPSKKQSKPISLVLPTSMVVAIPMGAPVIVGGPPTISIMALAGRAAFAAVGAGFRKLRKAQKQSERIKQLSQRLHRKAARWLDALGVAKSARHRVHKALCTMTGHPVDVATGKLVTDAADWRFEGPLPIEFERTWYSTSSYRGPLGHGWHHNFDYALVADDEVVVVRLDDGRTLVAPPLAVGERWFDRKDKLTLVREPKRWRLCTRGGHELEFADVPGQVCPLAAIADRSGNRVELRHDGRGHLREIIDSSGRRFAITCDADGRILELRGPDPEAAGQVTLLRYVYDRAGDLVEAHDALGQVTRYRYASHLLVQETDRAQLSFYFEYDNGVGPTSPISGPGPAAVDARCLRTWGDGGIHDHRLRYDDEARTTSITNGLGHTSVCHHSEAGLVDRIVDPLGHTSTTEFDEYDDVIAETDALGGRIRIVRDARGNPVEIVGVDGTTRVIAYDDDDRPLRSIDEGGGWWQWRYDARGRLLAEQRPDGSAGFAIWEGPRLAGVVARGGPLTRFEYDDAGHRVASVEADGARYERRYDRLGRMLEERAPTGAARSVRRDLLGQVVELRAPDGRRTELSYDGEGRVVAQRDEQRELELEWVGMGRLARRRERERAGAASYERRFAYDSEGRLIEFRNELGLAYRFERDARGRVITELGFDERRTCFELDALGRVTRAVLPSGRTRSYTWSRAGSLAMIAYDDGTAVAFTHGADRAMLSARTIAGADGAGASVVRIERDALGRVTREWQGGHWVAAEHDLLGRRLRMRSSFGAVLDVQRDARGAWTGLRYADASHEDHRALWQAHVERDVAGNELDRRLPGGVRSRWGRDALGRPFHHQLWDGQQVARDRRYTWGLGGRLDRLDDSRPGHDRGPTEFGHDVRGFLSWARRGDELELRLPDPVGNLHRSREGDDRRYGVAGELLELRTDAGVRRYEYDLDGNLIRRLEPDGGEWTYEWNGAGLLARVVPPTGEAVEFVYDAFARRIEKRVGEVVTRWVWDGDVPLHEWREAIVPARRSEAGEASDDDDERTGFVLPAFIADPARAVVGDDERTEHVAPVFKSPSEDAGAFLRPQPPGLITWLFDPASFAPVAKILGLVALSVITDHLGTPFSLLRDDGAPVWMAEFGLDALAHEHGDERVPFRFAGQYADAETGLCYNGFRYYDPEVGGYISRDPLGLGGGPRAYGYVEDPLIALDPLGLARHITKCSDLPWARGNVQTQDNLEYSYGVKNRRGGTTWVTTDKILVPYDAFEHIVRPDLDEPVTILLGNHGNKAGEMVWDHKSREMVEGGLRLSQYWSYDEIFAPGLDKLTLVDTRIFADGKNWRLFEDTVNREGRVVCAWCFSERSNAVLRSLTGQW